MCSYVRKVRFLRSVYVRYVGRVQTLEVPCDGNQSSSSIYFMQNGYLMKKLKSGAVLISELHEKRYHLGPEQTQAASTLLHSG